MTPHLLCWKGFAVIYYSFTLSVSHLGHHRQSRASLDFRSIEVLLRPLKYGLFIQFRCDEFCASQGIFKNDDQGIMRPAICREQVIQLIDPGETGSAFHRAGAEIGQKDQLWMDTT
jgi:hypothetical protein